MPRRPEFVPGSPTQRTRRTAPGTGATKHGVRADLVVTDLAGSEGWPYSPPDRTFVYVTIGHEEDVTAALGLEGKGVGETLTRLEVIHFAAILDRVGGGDSFASGLIYGLLEGTDLQTAVDYGAAHGALAMSTPGDTSMATAAEVIKLARGGSARVDR